MHTEVVNSVFNRSILLAALGTFGGLWWLLDATRRLVFNLLFLALLIVLAMAWFGAEKKPSVQEKTALVLNLHGELVEQFSARSRELLLVESFGDAPSSAGPPPEPRRST